jgi:hypothetical protein
MAVDKNLRHKRHYIIKIRSRWKALSAVSSMQLGTWCIICAISINRGISPWFTSPLLSDIAAICPFKDLKDDLYEIAPLNSIFERSPDSRWFKLLFFFQFERNHRTILYYKEGYKSHWSQEDRVLMLKYLIKINWETLDHSISTLGLFSEFVSSEVPLGIGSSDGQ